MKKLSLFLIFLSFLLIFSVNLFNQERKKEKTTAVFFISPFLDQKELFFPEPETILVEGNALRSFLPPHFVFTKTLTTISGENFPENKKEIIEYIVEAGDNLSSIAEKFHLKIETILWANNLEKNSVIKPGQKLIILPVDGILYHVKAGDTLSEIAKTYQAKIEDIVSFNELESPNETLYIGDILILPNGKLIKEKPFQSQSIPVASGYFICPVSGGCKITQGLHWYNAVDFSNGKCGEPILAAAGGKIQKVKYGWNGGAGNLVKIEHLNGVVTMYGHLSTIFVSPGQEVSQGEIIGLMGATGRATGCHLHFEVRGARNPFGR